MVSVRSITLLGHKDHGKSTLIGNLLMLTNSVTQTRIKEAETYSKKLNKEFEPAFILDSFYEEREGGLTIDITRAEIPYKDIAFSFIDVPGHEELIKNMISGASYANTALLLVSAKNDEGIRDQTKRHLFIAKMLGIDHLVVAVNKMDTIRYSEREFEHVRNELEGFIKKIGFAGQNVRFVPVSAYKGDNLVKKSVKMKWYKGKPILELLYEASETRASTKGDLRLLVQGLLENRKDLLIGRVVKGNVKVNDGIYISPLKITAKVNEITVKGKKAKIAKASENVALQINKKINGDVRGSVVCNRDYLVPSDVIRTLIFVTKSLGDNLSIRFNGINVDSKSIDVLKYVDPTTGEERSNGKIEPLSAIIAEMRLVKKIPAERFDEVKELGRFVLYSNNEFAGMGVIR